MLNLDQWITPNHFSVSEFEAFEKLTPREEFDLIAPVAIYFFADLMYKPKARKALKKLKALAHPMTTDLTVDGMLEDAPDGLKSRYNALMMAVVDEVVPGVESYIDEYGAFGFKIGDNSCAFMGDAYGFFAFYADSEGVVKYAEELEMATS